MNWNHLNTQEIGDLRKSTREGKETCAAEACDRQAVSVHHLDWNHSNNDPANIAPTCQPCHDSEHNISADLPDLKQLTREFYAVQNLRMALSNRVAAYDRLDIALPYSVLGMEDIVLLEAKLAGYIKALLKHNHFHNDWLKHVKGIGPLLSASLISELGSPERFQTVGQLWAYSGMHVIDGEAPRRRRGEKANWNGRIRMTLYKVSSSFVKNKCYGRILYDQYKAYYIERDGAEPKWQPHKRALRRVSKDFVRCLWLAWKKSKGLPIAQAHAETKVFPDDWIYGESVPVSVDFDFVPLPFDFQSEQVELFAI